MSETITHTNGDTPHAIAPDGVDDGALATERQEARIRLEAAREDHLAKLTELNRLATSMRNIENTIERKKKELDELKAQHAVQQVRTEAARKRVTGCEDEMATISKDRVRGPRSGRTPKQ